MGARAVAGRGGYPPGVLFDLDGTLLDSAPDMLATVNRMRAARGIAPMPLAALRPRVSRGARAMAAAAFPDLAEADVAGLVPEFLEVYREELGRHGAPFAGVEELLAALEAAGSVWGIVTNKPEHLAREILPQLGWEGRCAVLVGGDTLPERKPHPLPLLHAAREAGLAAGSCVYVGDDERDIAAARAAGMPSVVALWGYRLHDDDPVAWLGDVMVEAPQDLLVPGRWPWSEDRASRAAATAPPA
ncbi:phosphoglycolate phosphatase [Luteimonas sp. SJ-92]|uniref:Phosphoglycolate phosphatase n=1 Tax=Luteimonas salinisoli TaxID=2752307 RepID=A0A853JDD0_9GAMM|nr:phosphoglycolate phosphatase [Luteimonas salinisoli]NZA26754.1 phosphoglycolate phosphatase [Luteimonas salinisoli]